MNSLFKPVLLLIMLNYNSVFWKSLGEPDLTRGAAAAFNAGLVSIVWVLVLLAMLIGQSKLLFYDGKLLVQVREVEVSWLFTYLGEIFEKN